MNDGLPVILQVGFKIFLNVTPTITNWTSDNKQFSLIFDENPLADFVELPDDGRAQDELWYSNILCGVLRGALEMVTLVLFITSSVVTLVTHFGFIPPFPGTRTIGRGHFGP